MARLVLSKQDKVGGSCSLHSFLKVAWPWQLFQPQKRVKSQRANKAGVYNKAFLMAAKQAIACHVDTTKVVQRRQTKCPIQRHTKTDKDLLFELAAAQSAPSTCAK